MEVYLDGLERSGNVFLSYVLSISFAVNTVSKRTHEVDVLEQYKKDKPFFVPVRDALPSLVSAVIYRKYAHDNNLFKTFNKYPTQPNSIIYRFNKYLDYLLEHSDFFICPFEEFTNNKDRFIKTVMKSFPELKLVRDIPIEEIMIKARKNQNKNEYGNVPELSNLPREHVPEKQDVENMLIEKHGKQIEQLQEKINMLYKRYYDLVV